jgi:hypothetical protein
MGRRNKIYVMAACFLERDHDSCEFIFGYLAAYAHLADIPVLAEYALKVTSGKENGTGSACPYKGRLFAEMRSVA